MVPDAIWQTRGLQTLFGFAAALLLGAVITFVAHNWVHLSTGVKLGGLGMLLVVAAALWVWRRFDTPAAVTFGIAAQVLIGVWLAAAGQIFQAPGGLQDLALRWALLGLPFAFASRSWAHWAVWLAVLVMGLVSPTGDWLYGFLGEDRHLWSLFFAALVLVAAMLVGSLRSAHQWFTTLSALITGLLLLVFGSVAIFESDMGDGWLPIVAALGLSAASGYLAFRQRRRGAASVMAAGTIALVTLFLLRMIWDSLGGIDVGPFLISAIVTGGMTYGLVLIFKAILRAIPAQEADAMDSDEGTPWYMDVLIALGGFVTAMLGMGLLGSVIGVIAALSGLEEAAVAVSGIVIYAVAMVLRRREPGLFLRFMLDTFILIGGTAIVGGISLLGESEFLVAGLLLLGLSAATAWLVPRDRVLHVVLSLAAIAGVVLLLIGLDIEPQSMAVASVVILSVSGIVFGTEMFGGRRHLAVSIVFLLSAIIAAVIYDVLADLIEWGTLPRLADAFILIAGVGWLIARLGRGRLPSPLVTGVLMLIAVVLPIGAASALLILLLGYAVRSRALFGIGVAAMGYFLFATYYDLSLSLMEISGTMALTGGGLLALWFAARQRLEAIS